MSCSKANNLATRINLFQSESSAATAAFKLLILATGVLFTSVAIAQTGLPAISVNQTSDGTEYSLTLQILILMTVLTLLPSLLIMMTSFVRIIIVMSLLRQAIGTAQKPPKKQKLSCHNYDPFLYPGEKSSVT